MYSQGHAFDTISLAGIFTPCKSKGAVNSYDRVVASLEIIFELIGGAIKITVVNFFITYL